MTNLRMGDQVNVCRRHHSNQYKTGTSKENRRNLLQTDLIRKKGKAERKAALKSQICVKLVTRSREIYPITSVFWTSL